MKSTYAVNILYVLNLEYLQCTSISYYLVYIYYFRNFFSQIILHINISTITCLNLYTDGWTWTLVKILKKNLLFYEMFACYGNSPFFVQQYAIESRTQKKTLLNRLFLHENSNRSFSPLLLFPFKREWD